MFCAQEVCPHGTCLMLLTAYMGLALDSTPLGVAAGIIAALGTLAWERCALPGASHCIHFVRNLSRHRT